MSFTVKNNSYPKRLKTGTEGERERERETDRRTERKPTVPYGFGRGQKTSKGYCFQKQ